MITLLKSIFGSLTTAINCLGANMLISFYALRRQGQSDAFLELSMSMQIDAEMTLALSIMIACFIGHILSWKQLSLLDWPRVLVVSFICAVTLILVQLPWLFFGTYATDWTRLAHIVGLPIAALGMTALGLRYVNRLFD